jgi:hypothetical protein
MSLAISADSDLDSGIADLRTRYRPKKVTSLFVGESSPAQGTHFYRADSNLYRAIRAAFAAGLGEATVPDGEAFLKLFARKGCWLVDLAKRPVNRLDDGERRAAVIAGIPLLTELLRETKPRHVVVIKRDIAVHVERAIAEAGLKQPPSVLALRYPLRQYRAEFVRELGSFVRENFAAN